MAAVDAGYSNIILIVFDGMDWQTTRGGRLQGGPGRVRAGRGTGLSFQDFRRIQTDFGLVCTSPLLSGAKTDVSAQTVISAGSESTGGYDLLRGGREPWNEQSGRDYLLGLDRERPHSVTDFGVVSYQHDVRRQNLQRRDRFGSRRRTTSADRTRTPGRTGFLGRCRDACPSATRRRAAYANNVSRKDYQDIARDMIGLPSSAHRDEPLPGVDVLIGGGWGEGKAGDKAPG